MLGIAELKSHPWFDDFEWEDLESFNIKAPFIPTLPINNAYLNSPDNIKQIQQHIHSKEIPGNLQNVFKEFGYRNRYYTPEYLSNELNNDISNESINWINILDLNSKFNSTKKKNIILKSKEYNYDIGSPKRKYPLTISTKPSFNMKYSEDGKDITEKGIMEKQKLEIAIDFTEDNCEGKVSGSEIRDKKKYLAIRRMIPNPPNAKRSKEFINIFNEDYNYIDSTFADDKEHDLLKHEIESRDTKKFFKDYTTKKTKQEIMYINNSMSSFGTQDYINEEEKLDCKSIDLNNFRFQLSNDIV